MLDIKFIRANPDLVKEAARRKRIPVDIDRLLTLDGERRRLLAETEELRAVKNRESARIPTLRGTERDEAIARLKEIDRRLAEHKPALHAAETELDALMLEVPSPPAPEVPDGIDESDNVEIYRRGTIRQFPFPVRDHVAIGERLDLVDLPRGARIAGSRSYFLKNEAALMHLAVLRFAFEHLVAKGFVPMVVPQLVKDEAMIGTGYFPGGEDQAYRTTPDRLNLIGTAEVALASYHGGEILAETDLPRKYVGISACFRREAGAAGKDTRGLYRVHQFDKVEQVVVDVADPARSREHHLTMLRYSEEILEALGLPYRVVIMCAGDMGRGQIFKHDIETWMPGRNGYGETHSCSTLHDFQARRLNLRYRDAAGEMRFCHTLNNTALASPRILVAILENYQEEDGGVTVPEVLRPYLGGLARIEPSRAPLA
jgi:seryl-tRNA synthetase